MSNSGDILEITFAKLYGEIDHYTFTPDIFAKLYSSRLITSKETFHNYETGWEKNR